MYSRLLIAFCLLNAVGPLCAAPEYSFLDLGTFGGNESQAHGLNDLGQVVGYATLADNSTRAFVYEIGTGMTGIGGAMSEAFAINNLGQVTGRNGSAAFIYQNGVLTTLNVPGLSPRGMAINNLGQVVAVSYVDGTISPEYAGLQGNKPFFVSSSGQVTMLPQPVGASSGSDIHVYAINDAGMMVGAGSATPVVWGGPAGFEAALGSSLYDAMNQGLLDVTLTDVNESGAVAGSALYNNYQQRSFIYANDTLQMLPVGGAPVYLNDVGQAIYGDSFRDADGQSYLLSDITGDLNGFTLNEAQAINNSGQIVGWGRTSSGDMHAFLLTPVPEPGAALLLVLGCALTVVRRRRAQ